MGQQTRILTDGHWSIINFDTVTEAETRETIMPDDGRVITEVKAVLLRIGQIFGVGLAGENTITAQMCQYDSAGHVISSLTRNLTTVIPEDLRAATDRFKTGHETDEDMGLIYDLLLNCDEALALAR